MTHIKYILVDEWSAPTYCEHNTSNELYNECDASVQRLWVVSYDEDEKEIIEWLQDFTLAQEDEALAYIKALERRI